ncbi:MAG: glycosyltransferase family 4 protein [Microgenomates group bacterium]
MKRKTVGLYTPYLDVMGGGEKHILSILKVFDEAGYNVVIFWNTNLSFDIQNKLKLSFHNLRFDKDLRNMTFVEKAKKIAPLEWLFYVTDGSYFFSPAKQTAVFCMVPDKKLYHMSPINSIKTTNSHFIANSHFTAQNLHSWGIRSSVLYPYISEELFQDTTPYKKPMILTVGRFFKHLHAKKQDKLIQSFLKFHEIHPEYELVLAGGVKKEDEEYVEELKNAYRHHSVHFRTNISFSDLQQLYKDASFYWHFTGLDIDPVTHPYQVEHLGITPLEAMASRAIPFCYNAGGPREIIDSGKNGFLFKSEYELLQQMNYVINSSVLQTHLRESAYQFVHKSFRYNTFAHHVRKLFSIK